MLLTVSEAWDLATTIIIGPLTNNLGQFHKESPIQLFSFFIDNHVQNILIKLENSYKWTEPLPPPLQCWWKVKTNFSFWPVRLLGEWCEHKKVCLHLIRALGYFQAQACNGDHAKLFIAARFCLEYIPLDWLPRLKEMMFITFPCLSIKGQKSYNLNTQLSFLL